MLKSLFQRFFGGSKMKPEAPKTFKQKNRSIFMNRYAGGVYFLIGWHLFGYIIIKTARNKAEDQGMTLHEAIVGDKTVRKIELGKDFTIKITDSDDERPSN